MSLRSYVGPTLHIHDGSLTVLQVLQVKAYHWMPSLDMKHNMTICVKSFKRSSCWRLQLANVSRCTSFHLGIPTWTTLSYFSTFNKKCNNFRQLNYKPRRHREPYPTPGADLQGTLLFPLLGSGKKF